MTPRKEIGQATTPAEQDLEAAVTRVAEWQGRRLRYAPVGGGISNSNWRVWLDGSTKSVFVKIPGKGTELFIDRDTAMQASARAAAIGLGPRVYDYLAADGVEICDFIEGRRACTHADFRDGAICRAGIDAYRRLHSAEPLSTIKTVFDMIDEHAEQVRDLGGWTPPDMAWLEAETARARAAIMASGMDLVLSFNDPMAGNFMLGPDGTIMLIDYEYASTNDRCYDLGIWFGEMFYTETMERDLIEHYFGEVRPEVVARVMVYKAMADVKWSAWSMVQQKVSKLDFDFFKYGVWKYMRARSMIGDPRWEGWLARV